jgi:hypothetical protein
MGIVSTIPQLYVCNDMVTSGYLDDIETCSAHTPVLACPKTLPPRR